MERYYEYDVNRVNGMIERLAELESDQLRQLIKDLYIHASPQTKDRIDRETVRMNRDHQLLNSAYGEEYFQKQVDADLSDWNQIREDELEIHSELNEEYDDWYCSTDEEFIITDPHGLADRLLKLLWEAEAAARLHDWTASLKVLTTVYNSPIKISGEYYGTENALGILDEYFWKEPLEKRSIYSVFGEAVMDPSLTADQQAALMLQIAKLTEVSPELRRIPFYKEDVAYSFSFLHALLQAALTGDDLSYRQKLSLFEDVLKLVDGFEEKKYLICAYGELVPEIYPDYFESVHFEMTPEQIVMFLEDVLPKIPDTCYKRKNLIDALTLAKELLQKEMNSETFHSDQIEE